MLAPVAGPLHGHAQSGAFKRRKCNQLPKPCYLFNKTNRVVFAVALMAAASHTGPTDRYVNVTFCRCVALATPFAINAAMHRYFGAVFHLTTEIESQIRLTPAAVGGSVLAHFIDDVPLQPWRVVSADPANFSIALTDPSLTAHMQFPTTTFKVFGVVPDIIPIGSAAVQRHDEDAGDSDGYDHELDQPDAPAVGHPGGAPPTPHKHFTVQLERLAVNCAGGTVTHVFTPKCLLQCLELSRHLKPNALMTDVLATSTAILLGDEASVLEADIRGRKYHLPSVGALRTARVRLDLMEIIFKQRLYLKERVVHYLLLDASPQLGYNILATIEDTIWVPEPHTVTAHMLIEKYMSDLLPLSSLGLGKAGLVKKSLNCGRLTLMTSSSEDNFHIKRKRYRGVVADQGTEKGCGDIFVKIFPQVSENVDSNSADAYLYPASLSMPGMLHILYDALEAAVKACPEYTNFVHTLRITVNFLNNKQVRQRFQVTCFLSGDAEAKHFSSGSTVHIDWKWEFLSLALEQMLPKFKIIRRKFSWQKMAHGDSGMLKNNTIRDMAHVLKDDMFEGIAELYLMYGRIIEGSARELEICSCHAAFWLDYKSRKRRLAALEADIGNPHCIWQGRRLAWWIAVGHRQLFKAIDVAMTESLANVFATSGPLQLKMVTAKEGLRTGLLEILEDKLGFLQHSPYVAIGAFHSCIDGQVQHGRAFLQIAVDEVDAAIAAGKADRLHRVARRLFLPGSPIRAEADAWLARKDDTPLYVFVHLYSALLEYALIPIVERRIEAVHAKVKHVGKRATCLTLAQTCALVRASAHLDEVKKNAAFAECCIQRWRSRNALDEILRLRFAPDQLRQMSVHTKIRAVYQTGVENEFENTANSSRAQAVSLTLTAYQRQPAQALSETEKQCVQFLKSLFEVGAYFSMPEALFNLCLGQGATDYPAVTDATALSEAMRSIDDEFPECMWSSSSALFRVQNNAPERRTLVVLHHLDKCSSTVTVSKCKVYEFDEVSKQRLIASNARESYSLDLSCLVPRIYTVLRLTLRWHFSKAKVTPTMIELQSSTLALVSGSRMVPSGEVVAQPAVHGHHRPMIAAGSHHNMSTVVQELAHAQAFVGQGAASFLGSCCDNVDIDTLKDMATMGIVTMWEDDFSDVQVALNPRFVDWVYTFGLQVPVPLCHLQTSSAPLQKTKMELILTLHRDGWEHHAAPEAHAPSGSRKYTCDLRKPLSYFAALGLSQTLFDKHVTSVPHNAADSYYRCLLGLQGDKLQKCLAAVCTASSQHKFYASFLSLDPIEASEAIEDEPSVMAALCDDALASGGDLSLPSMLAPSAQSLFWTRVVAHTGPGTHRLKVYFDHFPKARFSERSLTARTTAADGAVMFT